MTTVKIPDRLSSYKVQCLTRNGSRSFLRLDEYIVVSRERF